MASRAHLVTVASLGLGAVALAWGASVLTGPGERTRDPAPPGPSADAPTVERPDAALALLAGPPLADLPEPGGDPPAALVTATSEGPSTVWDAVANTARVRGGTIAEPPARDDYRCLTPRIEIPREPGCDAGAPYPACRWQVPGAHSSGDFYRVWRNTTPEHRWAQPGLVSLVLAAAREYAQRWPGEVMTIGDLDAAGVRHQTHDAGHDVDLYLEHAMIDTNIGGGHYIPTYAGRPSSVVRLLRAQVMDLARILATCARGRVRIYYNDPEIMTPFLAWFAERGLTSDVGPAMVEHNRLHRFHFHLTIADGMEPLPIAPPDEAPAPE